MDCPMCTDKRKRGGLITTGAKISYNCFNCGFTTGWEPNPTLGKKYKDLADKLGATAEEIHKAQIEILKYAEILETEQETDYVYNLQKFDTVRLPESVISLDDLDIDHPVKKYAIDRGIDGLYPLMFFNEPLYKQRLVVPFTYNNELVGWTGRHINPPDKTTPKYLHNMPSGYVFNIDRFADSKREIVIVTEGVFDAIMIDGIAIQGNSVGPEQAHLIEKLGKRIIVCPDRDEAGTELMLQAAKLGWEVSFPPWHADCKDAADAVIKYGRLATVDSIIRNAVDNELKIKVRAKMV